MASPLLMIPLVILDEWFRLGLGEAVIAPVGVAAALGALLGAARGLILARKRAS